MWKGTNQVTKRTPILSSPTAAVTRIISLLEQSRASSGFHTYEHFHRTLCIWEAVLRQVPMGPWLEACRGMEFGMTPLVEALAILVDQAMLSYQDILGSVYTELGQREKRFGQYFTPWSVARMMAEITFGDIVPREPGQPPLRVIEPCVGSGILMLAAAETIEERCPGMIARGEVEFYGIDIDPVCVLMARLNMALHGIGRKVERLEDLSLLQRRAIERLIGFRLPPSGQLLAGPDLREADMRLGETLAAPFLTREDSRHADERVHQQIPVEGRADALRQDGTHQQPDLVAQDLWMTAGGVADQNRLDKTRCSDRRRKGSRISRQSGHDEYSQVPLFPLPSDQPPF